MVIYRLNGENIECLEVSESDNEMFGKLVTMTHEDSLGMQGRIIKVPCFNITQNKVEAHYGIWLLEDIKEGYHTTMICRRCHFRIEEESQ